MRNFWAGIPGCRSIARRTAVAAVCLASASSPPALQASKTARAPAALTFEVAVMQPAPPARNPSSRNTSEPGKIARPGKRSSIIRVFDQSPELSFTPATTSGNASTSNASSPSVIGTPESLGKW